VQILGDHIEKLRSRLEAASKAGDAGARNELLGEIFVGVHKLTSETQRRGLASAHRLSGALEELLRTLLERPALCKGFVLDAVADALDLLAEPTLSGPAPGFDQSSFRILVVDDDPISRRAAAGSIQLVFGRPECVESGEAALGLAGKQPFDLILMDVFMPGMDGFETCVKIRQTAANRETPILFITGCFDEETCRRATEAGGCGFLAKPVLPKEIKLRTLTLTLRMRLGRAEPSGVLEEVVG